MAAEYPSVIPTFQDNGAKLGSSPTHSTLHSKLNDEVEAIATELGTAPKGTDSSVKARLDRIESEMGDVTGPASSADNAIARFDSTTGKVIQSSGASVDDSGNISAANLSGTNTGDQTLPTDATLSFTDVTTNNASATKHGFLPKLENSGTKYLKDDGTWATPAGGATATRATFTNASLSTGVLTITHNLGLSAPYSVIVNIFNNSSQQIIPDNVTGATNSVAIDLTSYGTLSGTWGYAYIAG